MRRFLAFDIETAKVLPADVGDLLAHRPLGIVCAAADAEDLPLPRGWLKVTDAARLPLPDTSWMSDPPSRRQLTAWFPAGFALG